MQHVLIDLTLHQYYTQTNTYAIAVCQLKKDPPTVMQKNLIGPLMENYRNNYGIVWPFYGEIIFK